MHPPDGLIIAYICWPDRESWKELKILDYSQYFVEFKGDGIGAVDVLSGPHVQSRVRVQKPRWSRKYNFWKFIISLQHRLAGKFPTNRMRQSLLVQDICSVEQGSVGIQMARCPVHIISTTL